VGDVDPRGLHRTRAGWKRIPLPEPAADSWYLTGLSAGSPTNVWATGRIEFVPSHSQMLVVGRDPDTLWRHDGVWTEVREASPKHTPGFEPNLRDVVWTSSRKAWAVGTTIWGGIQDNEIGYIAHWDGHRWSVAWVSPSVHSRLVAVSTAGGMTWALGQTARGVILQRHC
jgi:hypothetical protein